MWPFRPLFSSEPSSHTDEMKKHKFILFNYLEIVTREYTAYKIGGPTAYAIFVPKIFYYDKCLPYL